MLTNSTFECPACDVVLGIGNSFTCGQCGLWWVRANELHPWNPPGELSEVSATFLRLRMREQVNLGCATALLILALFGCGSAWTIWTSRNLVPWSSGWFGMLISLPLGTLVGISSLVMFMQYVLHRLVPPRLDGDSKVLRVRVWHTWGGIFAGFRRTDAIVPREHIEGIAIGIAQGGHNQLFLGHRSGYHFYAGFTGHAERLDKICMSVHQWLIGMHHAKRATTDGLSNSGLHLPSA